MLPFHYLNCLLWKCACFIETDGTSTHLSITDVHVFQIEMIRTNTHLSKLWISKNVVVHPRRHITFIASKETNRNHRTTFQCYSCPWTYQNTQQHQTHIINQHETEEGGRGHRNVKRFTQTQRVRLCHITVRCVFPSISSIFFENSWCSWTSIKVKSNM